MSPERWRKVEAIFLAALERPSQERAAFLGKVCDDDVELRVQVEAMLAADGQSNLIDARVSEVAADLLLAAKGSLEPGQTFNHYQVIRELGRGGMGQVYLAHDSRLDRPVALKLLPHTFSKDPERVRRFQQEARVVSALNHPYIITIHDIGETDGLRFIVTEFIDGETLREIIARDERNLNGILKIIIQVAEALAAAHSVGIVHRDIKPENIMVRSDGYVKVLDFGIAKTNQELALDDSFAEIQPSSLVVTTPGVLLGTVKYMSPEQARGEMVDARSDIFSLGVVLYEAVTGRALFKGETRGDLLAAIAEKNTPVVSEYLTGVPTQLQRIIARALGKNLSERYQTAKEMARDLERLRDEITAGESREALKGGADRVYWRRQIVREIKRRPVGAIMVLTLLFLAVALSLGAYRSRYAASTKAPFSFDKMQFTKLTASGKAKQSAISPDGKYLVYNSDEGKGATLWLQNVATTIRTAVDAPAESLCYDPIFSPDGRYLYYRAFEKSDAPKAILFQVPMSGGAARNIASDLYGAVAISPSGEELAFTRQVAGKVEYQVILLTLATLQERILTTNTGLGHQLAWSPDGQTITTALTELDDAKQKYARIVSINAKTGKFDYWPNVRMRNIDEMVWLPDQSGVFITGTMTIAVTQIWYVAYPSGEVQRVTNDLNRYSSLSLGGASNNLVTTQSGEAYNVWMMPTNDWAQGAPITTGSSNYTGLAWLDDQRLITSANLTGKVELWRVGSDGSQLQQITFDGISKFTPKICGLGFVVFVSGSNGRLNLWRINQDGGGLVQLTDLPQSTNPDCLADGKEVLFDSLDHGVWSIRQVPLDGGKSDLLVEGGCHAPILSPDGRYFAYELLEKGPPKVVIRSLADRAIVQTIDLPTSFDGSLAWTRDGQGFTFVDGRAGNSELYYQSLAGGAAKKLTDFRSQKILSTAWSPDGKQLALSRGQKTSDVVEITGLK